MRLLPFGLMSQVCYSRLSVGALVGPVYSWVVGPSQAVCLSVVNSNSDDLGEITILAMAWCPAHTGGCPQGRRGPLRGLAVLQGSPAVCLSGMSVCLSVCLS